MRNLILAAFFFISFANADVNPAFFGGIEKSHYAFIGMEFLSRLGFAIENSVFTQGIEKQYIRSVIFYKWRILSHLHGSYTLFYGTRYDNDYYDAGAKVDLSLAIHPRFLHLCGAIQPFYDSFFGYNTGYQICAQSFVFQEIGFYGGFRNIPDYRDIERRIFAGISINSGNIIVLPELSLPTSRKTHLIRLSVNFIYKKFI